LTIPVLLNVSQQIHLADFRGKYSTEGLDVREMRAIWHNLPQWDEHSTNPLEVGKAEWRLGFKSRMDNMVYKMHAGTLAEQLRCNAVYEVRRHRRSRWILVVLSALVVCCFRSAS
jgi:hypothetical protein